MQRRWLSDIGVDDVRLAQLAETPLYGYTGHQAGDLANGITGLGGQVGVLQLWDEDTQQWGTVCNSAGTAFGDTEAEAACG